MNARVLRRKTHGFEQHALILSATRGGKVDGLWSGGKKEERKREEKGVYIDGGASKGGRDVDGKERVEGWVVLMMMGITINYHRSSTPHHQPLLPILTQHLWQYITSHHMVNKTAN